MKKAIIVLLFILVSFSYISVQAKDYRDIEVQKFVEQIKPGIPEWFDVKVKKGDKLYGINNHQIGYLYRLFDGKQQNGYILYLDGYGIAEATWEGTDKAIDIVGSVYYIIPGQFVSKEEFENYEPTVSTIKNEMVFAGVVYDIWDVDRVARTYEYNELSNFTLNISNIPNLVSNVDVLSLNYYLKTTIKDVPDYTWREGCVPTSVANMVAYFDNNVWDNLTPFDDSDSYSYTSSGNTASNNLIDDLADRFGTVSPNTDILYMGEQLEVLFDEADLSDYEIYFGVFDDTHIPNPFGEENISDYELLIERGNPVAISLYAHPTYSNHTVTGIGYIASLDFYGVIVHDNYSLTPKQIYISYDLVDYYQFIYEN